jgi:tRNA 5-methylaminomethyl-2-thiouridine biosynthesis bifunctional protein
MTATPLYPARLKLSPDGTPYSDVFDDVYHSSAGGLAQARHVFLGGNGLPERWRGRERFVVLETGFGLGLNFLATWHEWRNDPARAARLHFISAEKHPFGAADIRTLHRSWPEFDALSSELLAGWPVLVPGFHRLHLDNGRVTLTLLFGDAADCLPRLRAAVDAIYLDGFAPSKNPGMWSPQVFRTLARLAGPDATLATYSVSGAVRDGLTAAGFVVEKRAGFARKREMLAGRIGAIRRSPGPQSGPVVPGGRAVVVGAGLAGAACADRLASRGWHIDLIERHEAPAQEASGNHAGILMPVLSRDDNFISRLSRAGYLYALRELQRMTDEGLPVAWSGCGVLQLARDPRHAEQQREVLRALGYPADFVTLVTADEATKHAGMRVAGGGWLFPGGAWVRPPSLCRGLLERAGQRLRGQFSETALDLEHDGEEWCVRDEQGRTLARAPVVVLANGADGLRFPQASALRIQRVRGQVTHLPASALPSLSLAVCREGYVTPPVEGFACCGATYDFDDDPGSRISGHEANLERLERLLPGIASGLDPAMLAGRVGFRAVAPDRLPLVGALPSEDPGHDLRDARLADVPRWPGLYALNGYASRGLAWGLLTAELLASQLNGEPLPLESDLVDATDPARFLLRAHRRGLKDR